MKESQYFAARVPEDVAATLLSRANSFYGIATQNTYLDKVRKSYYAYHGNYYHSMEDSHGVTFSGEQGELVNLPVNHYRNIAEHIITMITANRPTIDTRAVNTDYKSQAQTILATGILDYYMREKGLEEALKTAVKYAVVLSAGFIRMEWNSTSGDMYDYDEETGTAVYEGEIEFSNLSPFDVVFDGTRESWNHDWVLIKSYKNKFNLAAKYPEKSEEVIALNDRDAVRNLSANRYTNDETDDIVVYEFYHKRTEALPDGRYIQFCGTGTILMDTPMPYRSLPVYRIAASEFLGTPYGYTPMFDLLPLQESVNSLYSTIMTNNNAFGVQNLFVQRGSDLKFESLEGGMNIIEGNIKPEAINLTATAQETYNFLQQLVKDMETISGVSSVTRGNPEKNLTSGNALALVQSLSLQFISGLQQSYVKLIEDSGTGLINILKDFAHTPKVAALVGKNNKTLLKEFTGESLQAINRVVCDMGNPLAKTIAGRVQMAEQMMQMGIIKDPKQYFMVMNTGRLDDMYSGEMTELLLIKSENEKLMNGETVQAIAFDDHVQHINEHKAVLADPDLRQQQEVVQSVLSHVSEHMDLLRNTDPDLLGVIGQKSIAQVPQMAPGGGSQNANVTAPAMGSQVQIEGAANSVQGPGVGQQAVAQPATPPPPFNNSPTNPAETV